jgi:YggT family protein
MLSSYQIFVDFATRVLFWLAVAAGMTCLMDWLIRTRRINPFSGLARLFRKYVDPLMRPIETALVRRGGQPAQAPFWMFLGIVIAGIIVIQVLGIVGGLLAQLTVGLTSPTAFVFLLIGWALRFVSIALIVRVISTWLPVSPSSRWIRWSYVSTEWLLAPLRRVIPPFGAFDITPIAAYLLLMLVANILRVW